MDDKQRKQLKIQLESEIKETRLRVAEYKEMSKPISPENAIGRISRMDAINNKSVTEAALRKAEEKLNNLQVMLTKIDSADFGVCIKCEQVIPMGRLMIRPHSRYCVKCAS